MQSGLADGGLSGSLRAFVQVGLRVLGVVENMRGALTARQTACGADVQYAPCMHRPGGLCAENAVQIRKRCRCDGRRETGVAAHRACIFAVGYARVSLLSRRSQVPDLGALFAQTEARRARSTWRTGARRVITAPSDPFVHRCFAQTLPAQSKWRQSGKCHTSVPFPWTRPSRALPRRGYSCRESLSPGQRSRKSSASCCRSALRKLPA